VLRRATLVTLNAVTRWAAGTGSDVMKRIAAPLVGGILTSFLLELVVYPPLYQIWKWNTEVKRQLPGAHHDV